MDIRKLDHDAVLQLLPDRQPQTHKGDYGKILLICGSLGCTGAPALSALGALRTGAGLVYLAVPESIYAIEAAKLLEPIILPLKDDCGMLSKAAVYQVCEFMQGKDAVLIGPGLGRSDGVFQVVKMVLEHFCGPVILDADGINVLQGNMDILRGRTDPTILTPHDGEFARISDQCESERLDTAKNFAARNNVILLLKGNQTIITDGNIVYLNQAGNPGMAVGGSGDLLAGMITSLLGQGLSPLDATACAAWIHGTAGDICAAEIGQYGMLPSDMLHVIPRLLK